MAQTNIMSKTNVVLKLYKSYKCANWLDPITKFSPGKQLQKELFLFVLSEARSIPTHTRQTSIRNIVNLIIIEIDFFSHVVDKLKSWCDKIVKLLLSFTIAFITCCIR